MTARREPSRKRIVIVGDGSKAVVALYVRLSEKSEEHSMTSLRLTFNKPTVVHHMLGDIRGVKVAIENGAVQFLPVSDIDDNDVLPLQFRTRGGAEVIVEGKRVGELKAALEHQTPFATLERTTGGWLKASPWDSEEDPPKFSTHIRVWAPKAERKTTKPKIKKAVGKTKIEHINTGPIDLTAMVNEAKALLDGHVPHRGRPSREISQARQLINEVIALGEKLKRESTTAKLPVSPRPAPLRAARRQAAEPVQHIIPRVTAGPRVTKVGRKVHSFLVEKRRSGRRGMEAVHAPNRD